MSASLEPTPPTRRSAAPRPEPPVPVPVPVPVPAEAEVRAPEAAAGTSGAAGSVLARFGGGGSSRLAGRS